MSRCFDLSPLVFDVHRSLHDLETSDVPELTRETFLRPNLIANCRQFGRRYSQKTYLHASGTKSRRTDASSFAFPILVARWLRKLSNSQMARNQSARCPTSFYLVFGH